MLAFDAVYHVGYPDRDPGRRRFSYEGPGLSVSRNPASWRYIARLGEAPCWRCMRKDGGYGLFVDFHALTDGLLETLRMEALRRGLLIPATHWRAYRWDEEAGEETFSVFRTREEAEREVGDPADDPCARVEPVRGFEPGADLRAWWERHFADPVPVGFADEFAVLYLIRETGCCDGVWWEDEHDPWALSAPRGVIFPERLPAWWWMPCEDPDTE